MNNGHSGHDQRDIFLPRGWGTISLLVVVGSRLPSALATFQTLWPAALRNVQESHHPRPEFRELEEKTKEMKNLSISNKQIQYYSYTQCVGCVLFLYHILYAFKMRNLSGEGRGGSPNSSLTQCLCIWINF